MHRERAEGLGVGSALLLSSHHSSNFKPLPPHGAWTNNLNIHRLALYASFQHSGFQGGRRDLEIRVLLPVVLLDRGGRQWEARPGARRGSLQGGRRGTREHFTPSEQRTRAFCSRLSRFRLHASPCLPFVLSAKPAFVGGGTWRGSFYSVELKK